VADADIVIRDLEPADLASAAGVIARGMRDNPLHVAAFGGDPEERGALLFRLFTAALPIVLSKGAVIGAFDDHALVGVAGMLAPGRCQPSMKDKLVLLPRIVPAVGGGAFTRVSRWTGIWARHDLREPHWHLGPVAVDAHLQGRGIGTRLLSEYCSRLDRVRGVGYLETDRAANIAFYSRFGFETVGSVPVLDTPNWFMKRKYLLTISVDS
jgi:ribosomal protein S18 acetylase RimI-like enzyme